MERRRTSEPTPKLTGEALLDTMRHARDVLVSKIKRGYGDERNRFDIERWRDFVRDFQTNHPQQWAQIAKERPRAVGDEDAR